MTTELQSQLKCARPVPWERCTLMSVDPCNNLHPTDPDNMLHSKTIIRDIVPYIFWNWNQRLRPFQAICLQNEKWDKSQNSHTPFRRGWRIPQHRVYQLAHRKMHSSRDLAHTPQQNGVIERDHRTTGEAERSAMLNMKNIPQEL